MKAVVDVVGASTGAGSNLSGVQSGRVNRRKDVENEEIQMYLSKLKDLVPFMPKNKKLTKLEVIEYVIDYICDLQYALETHPSVNGLGAGCGAELAARLQGENGTGAMTTTAAAAAAAAAGAAGAGTVHGVTQAQQQRQPLGVLAPSPNTIVQSVSCKSPVQTESTFHRTMSPVLLEKVQETDSRPISC